MTTQHLLPLYQGEQQQLEARFRADAAAAAASTPEARSICTAAAFTAAVDTEARWTAAVLAAGPGHGSGLFGRAWRSLDRAAARR